MHPQAEIVLCTGRRDKLKPAVLRLEGDCEGEDGAEDFMGAAVPNEEFGLARGASHSL